MCTSVSLDYSGLLDKLRDPLSARFCTKQILPLKSPEWDTGSAVLSALSYLWDFIE